MGAKNGSDRKTEDPLSEEELKSLLTVGGGIAQSIAALDDSGVNSRELSLVLTKLEEAEFWLDRAFTEMGYEPDDDDLDDDEPDDDEPDEADDEADEATGT